MFGIFKNLGEYLYSPDGWMVMYVFNHDFPPWLCFLIPVVHSAAWMALKTYLFWRGHQFHQRRLQHRRLTPTARPPKGGWLRMFWRQCKHQANRAYHWGQKQAHNKPMTERAFFWLGLEPQCQKAGCAILGILWSRFGRRGFVALCLGGVCQVICFCLLFMLFGNDIANIAMYCIFVPLGILALVRWARRNGANHTK